MKKAIGIIFAIMMVVRITGTAALASSYTTYKVINNEAVLYQTDETEGKIEIPEYFEGIKITAIGDSVYKNSRTLENISLPDTIEWIGAEAFSGCGGIKEAVIPKNVRIIERYTFYNCTALNSVTLPDGLCIIEEGAFEKTGLTEVEIPESVKAIEKLSFANCPKLERIIICEGTQIAEDAFEGSENVSVVIK